MTDDSRTMPAIKAYDIRGRIPDELNDEIAYKIGRAYATLLKPQKVCVGHDVRLSCESLQESLTRGLMAHGCEVINIGLCPTEQVYFTTADLGLDGGIMVTASHNPMDYNGMKLVREEAKPISGDTGLKDIERMILSDSFDPETGGGASIEKDTSSAYVDHLLTYVDTSLIKSMKVVANCGNGCANPILEKLQPSLPVEFIKLFPEPDGTFPNGIPNPILPENRGVTSEALLKNSADLAIAWDGDCDRCFFFDEKGDFIEGYYLVGLLGQAFLRKNPGEKVIHDPRLTWNTIEMVREAGGTPVQSKAGHAFIKEKMRIENAVYGGEMSAHHYFRKFSYCDSGMIPWLLLLESLSLENKKLSQMVEERIAMFPVSGEINLKVSNPHEVIKKIEGIYAAQNPRTIDHTDGSSVEFDNWRFNLRASNTEPVIRLNVEAKSDMDLLKEKTEEIKRRIQELS
jgi:phosphomannomutase/phosphomannomutase/phosphoglucomutase